MWCEMEAQNVENHFGSQSEMPVEETLALLLRVTERLSQLIDGIWRVLGESIIEHIALKALTQEKR